MNEVKDQFWVDEQSALVDSWWGAVAALMLLQSYSFILLQALVHMFNHHGKYDTGRATAFDPVVLVFMLIFALSQAGGLRVMNRYLQTHDWRDALCFWHSPVEVLKFVAAIICIGIYLYLLTGHPPFPRDSALYHDVGIVANLLFQLFSLGLSFVLNWLWKLSPKIAAMRGANPNDPELARLEMRNGIIGVLIAIPMGVGFVVISCYAKEFFYVAGVIGYGAVTLALCPALTRSPRSWAVRK